MPQLHPTLAGPMYGSISLQQLEDELGHELSQELYDELWEDLPCLPGDTYWDHVGFVPEVPVRSAASIEDELEQVGDVLQLLDDGVDPELLGFGFAVGLA
jgi:hypothetical protein